MAQATERGVHGGAASSPYREDGRMFADLAPGISLGDELIAGRRAEIRTESRAEPRRRRRRLTDPRRSSTPLPTSRCCRTSAAPLGSRGAWTPVDASSFRYRSCVDTRARYRFGMAASIDFTISFDPPDEQGWIVARVLEVPGAMSQGRTREEARENALDALRTVLTPDEELEGQTPDADREHLRFTAAA